MKNYITLKQKIVEILAYVLMWASIVIGSCRRKWQHTLTRLEMQMDMDLRIPFCFYQLLC